MKIGLTGDVMIGRLVNQQLDMVDLTYLWGDVRPLLHSTDFNLINLEAAITTSEKEVPKVFNFKTDPNKIGVLLDGSIDAVNLANNHLLDYDVEGLLETLDILDKNNILRTGAGKNLEEAKKPILTEVQGVKIGILGYTDNEPSWLAGPNQPGTNYIPIKPNSLLQVQEDIGKIRDQVDLLIVTIHWGPNMVERPPEHFKEFAHGVIDAGADVLHGHSAHIFQGIEIYQNRPILYDTGDFIDDYAVDPFLKNDRSFFFALEVGKKKLHTLRLVPTHIENCQVNLAQDVIKEETLARMVKLSAELGTELMEGDGELFFYF